MIEREMARGMTTALNRGPNSSPHDYTAILRQIRDFGRRSNLSDKALQMHGQLLTPAAGQTMPAERIQQISIHRTAVPPHSLCLFVGSS
ncbi:hypothetical protein D3C75_1311740 [compost metagenome]